VSVGIPQVVVQSREQVAERPTRWFDLRPTNALGLDGVLVRVKIVRRAYIDVGSGVRPEQLGRLAELARRLRVVDTVEIVGDTDEAACDAMALLEKAWA
jgi:hypothetical protein